MKRWPLFILAASALVFGLGLVQLFKLRYETGDVYPEYSSLRSDPLGAMALYEALQGINGLSVRRDFSEANQLPQGKGNTYLHLSASWLEWAALPEEAVAETERFVRMGGRLAITFFPQTRQPNWVWTGGPPSGSKKKNQSKQRQDLAAGGKSLKERWGIEFGLVPFNEDEAKSLGVSVQNQSELGLPGNLSWHSAMIFTNLDPAWQTIYTRGTNAVVVERRFGAGTVVMASDSYFISNEALRRDRHADLLAWFVGPARTVVFDEAHFGIVESQNVTALMRKYRLHGIVVGLVLLAGLFIWKNSSAFVPLPPARATEDSVLGRQVVDGFVNLLRRNIAPRDVLATCFEEWTKSLAQGAGHSITRVDQAQAVIEAENARAQSERNPVQAYREICRRLKGEKSGELPSNSAAVDATHSL